LAKRKRNESENDGDKVAGKRAKKAAQDEEDEDEDEEEGGITDDRKWPWLWSRPTEHMHKYTAGNVRDYADWVTLIPTLPLHRLKFFDESHFVARQLHRDRFNSPRGTHTYFHDSDEGLAESFSLSLLLDLTNQRNPFYINICPRPNTEEDFVEFMLSAIKAGRVVYGDYLLVTQSCSTAIQRGGELWQLLRELFRTYNITYLVLPAYSPELSPCSHVFSYLAAYVRNYRVPPTQVGMMLLSALGKLPYASVIAYYRDCLGIRDRILAGQ
jgi:hypothetical protein